MSKRSNSRYTTNRQYPRTARLNELVREIVADELERLDDERLDLLTVTAVTVEADMRHAIVLFDTLEGEAGDADALDALAEARVRLQKAIGRQARFKRVPLLAFSPDPSVRAGERVDSILRDIEAPSEVDADADADDADDAAEPVEAARPPDGDD